MPESSRWSEIDALLDRLFEMSEPDRVRTLEALAKTDSDLAVRVRELLDADAQTGLLEQGVAAVTPDLLQNLADHESKATADSATQVGRLIGRWRLQRELGRGGMGEVWLAERADGEFSRSVALKRLKRGMDSEDILIRFAQERRILASLDHPHIARLLDAGMDSDGRSFFVMELVDGEPITDYARRHSLSVRARLALMQQVCEAVAYAQSRLVVHRDLKPSNILIDARGEPRLLDFGIAKLLAAGDDRPLTESGTRVLSPAYAAPEQLLGETISTATDVYGLGLLLYELLTGQLPHSRSIARSSVTAVESMDETTLRPSALLRRQEKELVERAYGERAGGQLRIAREITGDLDHLVLAALRYEPERRYRSAAALAEDLRLYLDGRPIVARADSSRYRLAKFLRRHRVATLATTGVLLALLIGLGTALWQAGVAQQSALQALSEAERAETVKNFAISLISASNPEDSAAGSNMTALALIQAASKRVSNELADTPLAQAELRLSIGQSLAALGEVDEGILQVELGVTQMRALASDALLAKSLHALAMQYELVGRLDAADRASQEAVVLCETSGACDPLSLISLRTTLAKLAGFRGDLATMEFLHHRNLEDRRRLLGDNDARLAVDWNNLAAVALRLDRFAEAETAYAEAERVIKLDPESPESRLAWLRGGRGVALIGLGRYDEALQELELAIEIAERTLRLDHPLVGSLRMGISKLERLRGNADRARAEAQRAVAIFAAINHPDLAIADLCLGLAELESGNDAAAEAALLRARKNHAEQRNAESAHNWVIAVALGVAQLRLGDPAGQALVDSGLAEMNERRFVPGSDYVDAVHFAAAAAAFRKDQAAEFRLRREEVTQAGLVYGDQHPRAIKAAAVLSRLEAN